MRVTINRRGRDAIYDGLMTDLSAIGDVFIDLRNDEPASAKRPYRSFEVKLRLLDELGWEKEPEAERFERRCRRGSFGRSSSASTGRRPVRWPTIPRSWRDEAVHALTAATSVCPELLARLAEDDLLDPEV